MTNEYTREEKAEALHWLAAQQPPGGVHEAACIAGHEALTVKPAPVYSKTELPHQRDLQGALWGAEARRTNYTEAQAKMIIRAIDRANRSLANRVAPDEVS